jgi:CRP-like cAMP-binding protein
MNKSTLKPGQLRRIKSLALLSDEQLTAFLDFVEILTCPQSGTLFQEGQPGDSMFLILDGQMRVYSRTRTEEMHFLRMLEAGDAFGEVALLNHAPRSASVEAVRETVLIKMTSDALQKLVSEHPALAAQFLYHLARSFGRILGDLTIKLRARSEQADILSLIK